MSYEDLHNHKDCLRCTKYGSGEHEISRMYFQAEKFVKLNKTGELNRMLSAFDTEAMANVLDFLVFDDAMLNKGREYRDFKSDLVLFVGEIQKIANNKKK